MWSERREAEMKSKHAAPPHPERKEKEAFSGSPAPGRSSFQTEGSSRGRRFRRRRVPSVHTPERDHRPDETFDRRKRKIPFRKGKQTASVQRMPRRLRGFGDTHHRRAFVQADRSTICLLRPIQPHRGLSRDNNTGVSTSLSRVEAVFGKDGEQGGKNAWTKSLRLKKTFNFSISFSECIPAKMRHR